jgi:two-component system cell cycle sensor histidine kinase/response regulator CckA
MNGKRRIDLINKFPLFDDDGNVYAICGIVADISYRAEAESERQNLERKTQASQHMESLGALAGGLAHDFNNIPTAILGHSSMIRQKGGPASALIEPLRRIETTARRASELCEQMLTYAGQGTHTLTLIDLNEIVRDTTILVAVSLPRNIELAQNLSPELHAAKVDPSQLRQVVMNVIIDAADAIGNLPVRIAWSTFERTFTAAALSHAVGNPELPAGTYLGIEFNANGGGIDPSQLSRISDPFFTTKFHGRGLGHSTVLGIAQGHQGALLFESKPKQGCTFRLFLPATDEFAEVADRKDIDENNPSLSGTVLVVDDERAVLEVTVMDLEMSGWVAHSANSGVEAFELYCLHQTSIDVVLLDMTMPGLSGADTLKALREINPEVRAIILSGYSQIDAQSVLEQLEIDAFIQEPFELNSLLQKVAALLPRRQS